MECIFQNKKIKKSLLKDKCNILPQPKLSSISKKTECKADLTDKNHHARLGQYTANLWKEKVMTDVVIVVQNQEFRAHKAVLACYSPYFSDVFVRPGFGDVHYLQLPSVTAKAFRILLEYMYVGELKVTCQDLSDVYRSARKLGIKGAMKECMELLHVTTEDFQNMVYLYVTARQLKQWECTNRAFKLLIASFERLVMTKQFLDLDVEQILELFSSDELGARSEIMVFLASLKWINHKYFEREEYIITLFDHIRFPLMSKEEILACYHPPILPGIVKIPEVKRALLNATCYVLAKSLGQENLFSEFASEPRKFLFEGEPMILWDLNMYEPDKFEQKRRNHAAIKIQAAIKGYLTRKHLRESIYIANCAAVVIQSAFRGYLVRKQLKIEINYSKEIASSFSDFPETGKENTIEDNTSYFESLLKSYEKPSSASAIYIMGSLNSEIEGKGHNFIYKYDLKSKQWSNITSCPIPRHDARMIATEDDLYILGGYNPLDDSPLPSKNSYRYIIRDKRWISLPQMIHARSLHSSAIFDDMILVIGGKDDENKVLSSVERYDALKNRWEEFIPLPQPRMAMGATVCKDTLWVAGGLTSVGENISLVDSMWCFELRRGKWFNISKLPKPLAFPTLLSDEEYLFSIGGAIRVKKGETFVLESVENMYRLDYKNDIRWKKGSPMPFKCHNVVASISGGIIYVLGGFSTDTMTQLTDAIYYDKNEQLWFPFDDIPTTNSEYVVAMCTQA